MAAWSSGGKGISGPLYHGVRFLYNGRMNFMVKLPRLKIALLILLGYFVLILHPLLGHFDLFTCQNRLGVATSQTAIMTDATTFQGDCPLCHMAGSLTPGTAIAAPLTVFLGIPQPIVINIARPTAPIVPGLSFPRAPPTIG
jgi:hypothetical protein